MTRAELLEHICFTNYTNECSACDGRYNCQDCKDAINPLLDEYDKQIRAEVLDEVRDKMNFFRVGTSGYFKLTLDDWNSINEI